jgi:hypothetical protein
MDFNNDDGKFHGALDETREVLVEEPRRPPLRQPARRTGRSLHNGNTRLHDYLELSKINLIKLQILLDNVKLGDIGMKNNDGKTPFQLRIERDIVGLKHSFSFYYTKDDIELIINIRDLFIKVIAERMLKFSKLLSGRLSSDSILSEHINDGIMQIINTKLKDIVIGPCFKEYEIMILTLRENLRHWNRDVVGEGTMFF